MSFTDQDNWLRLPLELVRKICSCCSSEEVVLVLPQVSRLLYRACTDANVLRNVIRCDLYVHFDSLKDRAEGQPVSISRGTDFESLISKALRCIENASANDPLPERCWKKWTIAISQMTCTAFSAEKRKGMINFGMLLRLMQYLPHSLVVGGEAHTFFQPKPFWSVPALDGPEERQWLIEIIATYFLDVTGGPGFRTKHYVGGLDMHEINLRMALCMTVLVLQLQDAARLFQRDIKLSDQSIADWLSSAIIYSRDWWAMSNQPLSEDKLPINPEIQTLLTIMFIGTAMLHRRNDVTIMFPDISKIPLFTIADPLSPFSASRAPGDASRIVCPVPFDLQKQDCDLTKAQLEVASTAIGFDEIVKDSHLLTLGNIDAFLKGPWCIYYVVGQHCDLRAMRFEEPVRGIHFHATAFGDGKWFIDSAPFEEDSRTFKFSGKLVQSGIVSRVVLDKSMENGRPLYESHLHGQLSPFGISGGYFYTNPWSPPTPGGLFWLWKEEWIDI